MVSWGKFKITIECGKSTREANSIRFALHPKLNAKAAVAAAKGSNITIKVDDKRRVSLLQSG